MGCLFSKMGHVATSVHRTRSYTTNDCNGIDRVRKINIPSNNACTSTEEETETRTANGGKTDENNAINRLLLKPPPPSPRAQSPTLSPRPLATGPPTPEDERPSLSVQYAEDLKPAISPIPSEMTLSTDVTDVVHTASVSNVNVKGLRRPFSVPNHDLSIEELDTDMDDYQRLSGSKYVNKHNELGDSTVTDVLLPRRKDKAQTTKIVQTDVLNSQTRPKPSKKEHHMTIPKRDSSLHLEDAEFSNEVSNKENTAPTDTGKPMYAVGSEKMRQICEKYTYNNTEIVLFSNTTAVDTDNVSKERLEVKISKSLPSQEQGHRTDVGLYKKNLGNKPDKSGLGNRLVKSDVGNRLDKSVLGNRLDKSGIEQKFDKSDIENTNDKSDLGNRLDKRDNENSLNFVVSIPSESKTTESPKSPFRKNLQESRNNRKRKRPTSKMYDHTPRRPKSSDKDVDGFLKSSLKTKQRPRQSSATRILPMESKETFGSNDTLNSFDNIEASVSDMEENKSMYSYLGSGTTPISFKSIGMDGPTEIIDIEDTPNDDNDDSWLELDKCEQFDAWYGIKPYNVINSSDPNDSFPQQETRIRGPSTSEMFTKQKLLYAKYARRPKSESVLGGRPPLPPGAGLKYRPTSETTIRKPQTFSKYFASDVNMHC